VYTLGTWQGNVTDDFGVDWVVESEDGWSSTPPIRPTQEEKTVGDGSWSGPGFYSARVISLAGRAITTDRLTMLAAKDRLKAALGPRTPVTLLVDEAHLSRKASVRLTDQIHLSDHGSQVFEWGIIVTAADPRRYSAAESTQSTGLSTSSTGGRTYPRTYPLLYGGASDGESGSVTFINEGDYDETPAKITFTGPLISPQVAHPQTSRSLTFNLTLEIGETLVVDLANQTALLNGSASRVNTITPGSAWFMAVPGLNEFQFRGQDPGTGTPPSMTVTAASAWT
jgi:hypothetical protein